MSGTGDKTTPSRPPAERPDGRDAWAIEGFAPVPGDRLLMPRAPKRPAPASGGTGLGATGDVRATDPAAVTPDPRLVTIGTVYLCAEQIGEITTRWTWAVLHGAELLEIAPRGCYLYAAPRVLDRGSGPYLELVAQDGALVRFEERVRVGTWEDRPVHVVLGERRWRITSTGTVAAHQLGPRPRSAWRQISGTIEQPVYATLTSTDGRDLPGLIVWATDVLFASGRSLGLTPGAAGIRASGNTPGS